MILETFCRNAGAVLAFALLVSTAPAPATATSYNVVYTFPAGAYYPTSGLVNVNGALYGTTPNGGSSNSGTVFKMTPAGVGTFVYQFQNDNDGAYPQGNLLDVGGKLYGTTPGGAGVGRTVFQVTQNGKKKIISPATCNPNGDLINVGGTFYGTDAGGCSDVGSVFSVTPSGNFKTLYTFQGRTDGAYPSAGLLHAGGALYGTTYTGGANGYGTVFKVTTSGAETVLYSFKGGTDGANPNASLVELGGKLYGTTVNGGIYDADIYGEGTVFSITTTGVEAVVYAFHGSNQMGSIDGSNPFGALINVGGLLYGTTVSGGVNGNCCGRGTIFSVTPDGTETILYNFGGFVGDGEFPTSSLTNVGGTLYGTTQNSLGPVGTSNYPVTKLLGLSSARTSFKHGSRGGSAAKQD